MANYNKFQQFVEDLGKGVHDLNTHTLKVYLTNATPDAALDAVKVDLAEITNENGYTAPVDIQNTYTGTAGTGTLAGVDVTVTASGGTVGPFRYAVVYNDDPTSPADPLVCWWDYGSSITLQAGESFKVDFGDSILTIA